MSSEVMEMMGKDQEATPAAQLCPGNSLNKKPACTKRAEQSLIYPLQQFTCVSPSLQLKQPQHLNNHTCLQHFKVELNLVCRV